MDRLHTYNLLEFNKVLELVCNLAQTSTGKEKIANLEAIFDSKKVEKLLDITDEGIRLVTFNDTITFSGKIDLENYLKHVEVDGFLTASEFLDIYNHISVIKQIISYDSSLEIESVDYFKNLVSKLTLLDELEEELKRCIDINGNIRDSASFEIRKYRKNITSKETEVKNKLSSVMNKKSSMLSENIITIRNNRQVLAVKSEYKHIFGGIIHDESISGQTVYIEPEECVTINNSIVEFKNKLKNEIEKILKYLSSYVKVRSSEIRENIYVFTELDVMFAKARYARGIDAVRLKTSKSDINLISARHPLIDSSVVVSNDIIIKDEKLMVITGANTGGKTITLKTVGLFALMHQCGLFVSASTKSTIPIFDKVFTLMGDNQSLENNLSTFSSHILDIKYILENTSSNSLVLLDEIGNGTNPSEGSALAIAVLEALCDKGCKTIATTHYNELKEYAQANDYVMNASVKFDTKNLTPTYKLMLNTSGLSYALMISRRLGLSAAVVDNATKILEDNVDNNVYLLDKISAEKIELEELKTSLNEQLAEVEKLKEEIETKQLEVESSQYQIISRAKKEANTIIDDALKRSEAMISQISKTGKHHELLNQKKQLEAEKHRIENLTKESSSVELEIGDEVLVLPFETKGVIQKQINDNEYEVLIGSIKSKVKKANLIFNYRKKKQVKKVKTTVNVSRKVNTSLDLRGMRALEASEELEQYFDKVKLSKLSQVIIIHGYGTGAVRKVVVEYLRSNNYQFRSGAEGEGGSGATVVTIK